MTSFQLKLIAIIAMLIDHIGFAYPEYEWMRYIGRITMPIICFFVAQGYFHTKDKFKYGTRLFLFAVISEIPFSLYFSYSGNVIWTLFFGMLALWAFDSISKKMGLFIGVIFGFIPAIMLSYISEQLPMFYFTPYVPFFDAWSIVITNTDYSYLGVFAIFITGIAIKYNFPKLIKSFAPSATIGGIKIYMAYAFVNLYSIVTIFVGFIILSYNGKRGYSSQYTKYVFYIFYPLHLILLWWFMKI